MPDDEGVTLNELHRNIRDMRMDYERGLQETRTDTQKAINNMQRSVDKLVDSVERLPYVRQDIFEERMKTAGERIGKNEQEVHGVKNTLGKINFTAWTAIVLPLAVGLLTALLLAAVNLR